MQLPGGIGGCGQLDCGLVWQQQSLCADATVSLLLLLLLCCVCRTTLSLSGSRSMWVLVWAWCRRTP